jgi:TetR/AcrR family transcriptional regulator
LVVRSTRGASAASDPSERILEAALRTFAENGFDGATTREIARRAGVPLGLLQYYFGGKLKLWQAAVDQAFSDIRSALDAGAALAPAGEGGDLPRIRAAIRAHVRFVGAHPEFVRLMHDEGKRRGPRMRWMVDRHVKPMFERVLPMIRHLQQLGRLPDDVEPFHFVYGLVGAIDTIFHQAEECRRLTGADPADPAFVERHARTVEWMLLGPVASA